MKAYIKKVLALSLILSVITATAIHARSSGELNSDVNQVVEFILPDGIIVPRSNEAELRITDREILDEIVRLNSLVSPDGITTLQEIIFVPSVLEDGIDSYGGIDSHNILRSEIRNVRPRPSRTHHYPGSTRHFTLMNHSSHTTDLSVDATVSAWSSFSSTMSLSHSFVSAGVGFTTGRETTTTSTAWARNIPPGGRAFIDASMYAHVVDFDVYNHRPTSAWVNSPWEWIREGSGFADRPDGVRFFIWS